MKKMSGAQLAGWIVFWVNYAVLIAIWIVYTIHPKNLSIIPNDLLSSNFTLGIYLFVVLFVQGIAGIAIKKLHEENYWSIVLLIIGIFFNWFYIITAVWGMVLNQKVENTNSRT